MAQVLIIEDDEQIRLNIAEILSIEGYAALEAQNGVVGVQLARDYLPDLIICDVMMPELDGYGVLMQLRTDPATALIPFIFLTARADRPASRHGMELGADDYLTKPFTPSELLGAVSARLERQSALVREYESRVDELRGSLLRTLPHELRTPLTGILGYAEMLMTAGDDLSPAQTVNMASRILHAGQRLFRLIENFLLYAQIEIVSSDPPRAQAFRNHVVENPAELIAETAAQQAREANRAGDLTVAVEDVPVRISADNLRKIVNELVDNALKFSQPGARIDVRAGRTDHDFALQITDRGRGMTAEQIKNIGAYMQFERKLYEQQGSGLGLVISRRLAELHGGELLIESTPGEQTVVLVTLPLV